MKRRHLIGRVHDRAKRLGKAWDTERRGGRHDLWRCGGTVVTIPRHREINQMTAQGIMKTLEAEARGGLVAMTTKTYTARCVRSGDWWAITVPQVRGVHTQARRLSEAEAMARDAIALVKDVPADSFAVAVAPDLPPDVAAEVDAARELRETAERYQREATAAARAVARKLVELHRLPFRDVGRILGLSHQRIGQLLAPPPEAG